MKSTQLSEKKKSSFLKVWFGFFMILINFVGDVIRTFLFRYVQFFKRRPVIAIAVPVGLAFVALVVASAAAYVVIDYTMFHPKFCITCHGLMIDSYVTWEKSNHKEVNCHTCHPLTPEYVQSIVVSLVNGVVHGFPETVPAPPPGKIIVPSKICNSCHWEKPEKENKHVTADSPNVASSRLHAIHAFMGQIECMTCHGDQELHVFSSQPGDCLNCHQNYDDQMHAATTAEVACLNCHTDQTADLSPTREKCLSCHSADPAPLQQLAEAGTLDVRYAPPAEPLIAAARKIVAPDGAAMQTMNCSDCHASHPKETTLASDTCLSCHAQVMTEGQHPRHVPYYQGNCQSCHQPHGWKIDTAWAQQECAKCHPYLAPSTFTQAKP